MNEKRENIIVACVCFAAVCAGLSMLAVSIGYFVWGCK